MDLIFHLQKNPQKTIFTRFQIKTQQGFFKINDNICKVLMQYEKNSNFIEKNTILKSEAL